MDIHWIDATNPTATFGRTPDGGFVVHASLHPLGLAVALERAKRARINLHRRNGEAYMPMPWLRSELSRMRQQRIDRVPPPESDDITTALNQPVSQLLDKADVYRSDTWGGTIWMPVTANRTYSPT